MSLAREEEQLRQEVLAFNQLAKKDLLWFYLRLVVGGASVALLIAVVVICCYIFFNAQRFPDFIQKAAAGAFFGDVVGLLALVWKVIINPAETKVLAPVTKV